MAKACRSTEGYIYFIHAPAVERVKIGFTVNLKQRFRELSLMSPVPMELVTFVRGTLALEIALLAIFEKYRSHGEWFVAQPDIFLLFSRLTQGEWVSAEDLIKK